MNETDTGCLPKSDYFYIFSFPRSGNTWLVNSLKDYLGTRKSEILPSRYGGRLIALTENVQAILAGSGEETGPIGIKSHMPRAVFLERRIPMNKMLYVYRDPRDVMISYFFYRNTFLVKGTDAQKDFDDRLFSEHLSFFLPKLKQHLNEWLRPHDDLIFPVRYEEMQEDFVGTLQRIRAFLGYENIMSETDVKERYRDNFEGIGEHTSNVLVGDNAAFYRKGIVGDWKNYFNDEHVSLAKQIIGNELIDYRYEEGPDW